MVTNNLIINKIKEMNKIQQSRKEIDEVDRKIVELLEKRVKLAEKIGIAKQEAQLEIRDKRREKKVLENICKETILDKNFIENLFKDIIDYCKRLQVSPLDVENSQLTPVPGKLTGSEVFVLGPRGTFTEIAAGKIFGKNNNFNYKDTIEDVFIAAEQDGFGVVPVENSLEGGVSVTMDCLIKYNVKIYGEINIGINLFLIGNSDKEKVNFKNIKTILSHPQAFAQSRNYLEKNFPGAKLQSTSSTAAAMKELGKMEDALAVGPENNAEIYNLKIIDRNINDDVSRTRFIVISKKGGTGNKTSIIFALKDRPGALFDVLNEFAKRKINLTKIESRPSRRKLGEYFFFVDFEGNLYEEEVKEVMEGIEDRVTFLKVLGSY